MFLLHSAFAVQLLTLIAAAALLAWTGYTHVYAQKLVRAIAYSAGIVTILSLLCTAYYGAKYSRAGFFESPMGMHGMMQRGTRGGNMMEGMMGGEMKNGMMNGMGRGGNAPAESATPRSDDQE